MLMVCLEYVVSTGLGKNNGVIEDRMDTSANLDAEGGRTNKDF